MAIIGFFMLPEPGHLNGPVKFAKLLAMHGYQSRFFGPPEIEGMIGGEKAQFVPVFEKFDKRQATINSLAICIVDLMVQGKAMNTDLHALLDQAVKLAYPKDKQDFIRNELADMIEKLHNAKLDLLLVDYGLLPIAFIAKRLGINCAILNPTISEYRLLEGRQIDFPAALQTPVLRLCPQDFDFPHAQPKSYACHYLEPSVDLDRQPEPFDFGQLPEPFIFCSFGSQRRIYEAAGRVVRVLIEIGAARPDWRIVISLGGQLRAKDSGSTPSNVRVFDQAPQLQALKRASMMITHGGLNSVKECILLGVPMIVIPFDTDQPLNAARVSYHGLGLAESPQKISFERLSTMINRVLGESQFRTRTELMRRKFSAVENSGIGVKVIEKLLRRRAA
jgi:UDP:flavonoid glycosyltransferase YjiC (YdhE family)